MRWPQKVRCIQHGIPLHGVSAQQPGIESCHMLVEEMKKHLASTSGLGGQASQAAAGNSQPQAEAAMAGPSEQAETSGDVVGFLVAAAEGRSGREGVPVSSVIG